MDLPPPVQDPERREGADDPARRLAAVEAELIALGSRLEQVEASLQQAVRDETRRASNEIRHTVSELGRRLALDLPQFLDRHRQLIVNELRGPAGPAAGVDEVGIGDGDGETGGAPDGGEEAGTDGGVPAGDAADGDLSSDAAGVARRKRRRRKDG